MMPLRRFQPISRSADWRARIVARDPVTGQAQDLSSAVLSMALLRVPCRWGYRDYGRWFDSDFDCRRYQDIVLSAQTKADGSGYFTVLPTKKAAEFVFPPDALAGICGRDFLAIVVIQDAYGTRELYREPVVLLPGISILPFTVNGGLLAGSGTDLAGSGPGLTISGLGGTDLALAGNDLVPGGLDISFN